MNLVSVLCFAADPSSAPGNGAAARLLLDEEVRLIREKVRAAQHRESLVFDVRWAVRTDDLLQALNEAQEQNRTPPQVVHFSGHGGSDGLVLVGKDGKPHPVGADALRRLFTTFRGDIRLVVLNACFSRPQAQAIADVVGCAIGTRGQISDTAAITFGASFYRAIAFGQSVQAAYDQAATALALDHVADHECPVLVVRPGVDPSKLILIPSGPGNGPAPAMPGPASAPPHAAPSTRPATPPDPAAGVPDPRSASPGQDAAPSAPPSGRSGLKRLGGTAAAVLALGAVAALGIPFLNGRTDTEGQAPRDPVSTDTPVGRAPNSPPRRDTVVPAPEVTAVADSTPLRDPPATEADVAAARARYDERDFVAAFPLFERAAAAGNAEAMAYLGIMLVSGEGTARAPERGVPWLRRSAAAGNARGLNALGVVHQDGMGGVTRDPCEAKRLYERAQAQGFAKAMNNLGQLYRRGWCVDQDDAAALEWYRKAADAGDPDGRAHVGAMYTEGFGVPADTAEAVRWFRSAVAAGSLQAMVNLGRIREHEGDYNEARALYLQAADGGSAAGMNNLGTLYYNGRGFPKDRNEAIRWFRRAAQAGDADAAANLLALGVR